MAKKLTIEYDAVGDILSIDTVEPYAEQDSDDLGDEVISRFHPVTGEIENVEILFFLQRVRQGEKFELLIDALLKPASIGPDARSGDDHSDGGHG
jgi:hypothetical protein